MAGFEGLVEARQPILRWKGAVDQSVYKSNLLESGGGLDEFLRYGWVCKGYA